jgi:hypothetical protein
MIERDFTGKWKLEAAKWENLTWSCSCAQQENQANCSDLGRTKRRKQGTENWVKKQAVEIGDLKERRATSKEKSAWDLATQEQRGTHPDRDGQTSVWKKTDLAGKRNRTTKGDEHPEQKS